MRMLIRHSVIAAVMSAVCLSAPVLRGQSTELADAAEQQQWDAANRLLDAGADPRQAQADGTTALHWAVWHEQADVVERLLQAGAVAEVENAYQVAPLSLACQNGNASLAQLLLQHGADPGHVRNGGETALMTAARTGDSATVRLLLEAGADVNAREHRGQSAIMWAAAEGHSSVVEQLIAAGADFTTPLKSGFTPALFAARQGHQQTVRVLLDAGVAVNDVIAAGTSGGRAPRRGTGMLMLAVENAHFDLALWLIQQGADPNDQRSGVAPLHALTWVRKPNFGDGVDGDPPPAGSGQMTSLDFIRAAVAAGADVNLRLKRGSSRAARLNRKGATPFLMAADTADLPCMQLLYELGADPALTNAEGVTALMLAAGLCTYAPGEEAGNEAESLACVDWLLDLELDVNAVDENGDTAMHGAAYASFPEMVRFLHAHGADVSIWNRRNQRGWTPHLIAEGHRPGNFKPAPATLQAVREVMTAAGVELPAMTPRRIRAQKDYSDGPGNR